MKRGKNSNTTILELSKTSICLILKNCVSKFYLAQKIYFYYKSYLFVQEFLSHYYVNFAKDKKIQSIFVLWLNFSFTNIILSSLKDFLHFEIEFYSLNIALNVLKLWFFFKFLKMKLEPLFLKWKSITEEDFKQSLKYNI